MPSDYARRGRPRGSGLDDRAQLRRIAELIEADPTLRPTTAIKALGVSDPSTIRRLRDKLKTGMTGAPNTGSHGGECRIHSAEMLEARREAVPAQRGTNLGSAASGGFAQVVPASMSEAQLSWFTQWCAFGLFAVSSTAEAHRAMMDEFFRVPQVASALREQIRLNEAAKAFCPKRSDIRTTLH